MASTRHPVVIIGAGFSGIISLKICIENGLDAVIFEKSDNFGGLWRYRDNDEYGLPSVQQSTVINTSKEMSAMSDFPPPSELSNYMHNTELLKYLEGYIKHFNLEKFIRFRHQVIKVEKGKDYIQNGQWNVKIRTEDGHENDVTAKAVFMANGHHVYPTIPEFPGLDGFRGTIMHTHSYKNYKGLENKRVLVVGFGNSAIDAAVEISSVNSKVFFSTRRGSWIVPRVGENGIPFDIQVLSRYYTLIFQLFPNVFEKLAQMKLNKMFDHGLYNVKPKHNVFAQHVTISDAFPVKVISGAIVVKGDVDHFTPTGVVFKGEDGKECPIDAVVLATGYSFSFPILEDVIPVEKNQVGLYFRVFPPELQHPTFAVIGLIQPLGCIFPITELQARWACQLIKGEKKLPPIEEQLEEIRKYKDSLKRRYVPSPRHTIQVDFVPYTLALADQVGCQPNLTKIAFTDPALFFKLFFGPTVSYQFRLQGPHPWPGARNAIMTVMDRVSATFNSRHVEKSMLPERKEQNFLRFILVAVFLAVVAIFFFKMY